MTEPFGINNVLFEPPEGFAHGNYSGLTPRELYDMTEIWTCLGVLVQPLHAKCIEARNVGIFNGIDVPEDDPVREETILGKSNAKHMRNRMLTLEFRGMDILCSHPWLVRSLDGQLSKPYRNHGHHL
jgi:hypothetical protein